VAYALNDNLVTADLIENQVGIGIDREAPQPSLARSPAHLRMLRQEIDQVAYPRPDATSPLRRSLKQCKTGPDQARPPRAWCNGSSQTILRPDGPHFLVGRKLTLFGLLNRLVE
jgi:hypothetical protein